MCGEEPCAWRQLQGVLLSPLVAPVWLSWYYKCLKSADCSFVPRARIKWHASNSCPHSFFCTLPPSSGSRPSPQPFIGTFFQLSSDPAHNDDLWCVPSFLKRCCCRPARNRSQTLWVILEEVADTLDGMQRLLFLGAAFCDWDSTSAGMPD